MNGEINYDRINDYDAVRISLAGPDEIRSWSSGEVKKPEAINYLTFRPEKDGLFCEKIFGPEKDWECFCGKYGGVEYEGVVCDNCGVKVTHTRVRRERMGHIELAAPVAHIWFFKAMPSRIGDLLGMKTMSLEKVIYFQDYVVLDPGKHGEGDEPALKVGQLLTEEEYSKAREQLGDDFVAEMGAEAIENLLAKLDLARLSEDLREDLARAGLLRAGRGPRTQAHRDLVRRLRVVEALGDGGIGGRRNKPEWMILRAIPVIPPGLRPLVLESGNFAPSDLNDLYRNLINRNNRLKKLVGLDAPEVIIRNEKRMLQQCVDALFDNNRCKRPVLGSSNRPLKSLTDRIKGEQGRLRERGKRVDYSARSVIVPGPELKLHQCGLPKKIALELFQPFIIRRLMKLGHADTIPSAKVIIERKDDVVWGILEEVLVGHPVLLHRRHALDRTGMQAFEPVLTEGNAIRVQPLVCKGPFDGGQMAVHLPLSIEARVEASVLMKPTNNLFSPANGQPIIGPSADIVMGCYYLTAHMEWPSSRGEGMAFASPAEVFAAWDHGKLDTHARIRVRLPMAHVIVGEAGDSHFRPGQLVTREEFYAETDRLRDSWRAAPAFAETHAKKLISDARRAGGVKTEEVPRRPDGIITTTVGRVIFNAILNPRMAFYDVSTTGKQLARVLADCHLLLGRRELIELLDRMKTLGFREATRSGLSLGMDDLKTPTNKPPALAAAQAEVDAFQSLFETGDVTERERHNRVIDLWTKARDAITEAVMKDLKNDLRENRPYLNPIYLMAYSGARGGVEQIRRLCGMGGLVTRPDGSIPETSVTSSLKEGLSPHEYFSGMPGTRKALTETALRANDLGHLFRKLAEAAQNVVITMEDCCTNEGISKSAFYNGEEDQRPLSEVIRGRVVLHEVTDPMSNEVVAAANEMLRAEAARKIECLGIDKVMVRSPLYCKALRGVCRLCYGMDLATGTMVEEGMAVGIIAAQSLADPGVLGNLRTWLTGRRRDRPPSLHDVMRATEKRYTAPNGGRVRLADLVEGRTLKTTHDPMTGGTRREVRRARRGLRPRVEILGPAGELSNVVHLPEGAVLDVQDGQPVEAGVVVAWLAEAHSREEHLSAISRLLSLLEARGGGRPSSPPRRAASSWWKRKAGSGPSGSGPRTRAACRIGVRSPSRRRSPAARCAWLKASWCRSATPSWRDAPTPTTSCSCGGRPPSRNTSWTRC